MKPPGFPKNESERLRALESYSILDTGPEPGFDDLTTLVARMLGVPIALVSLVDADRQWFKSRYGLDAPETPRDVSFCGHVVVERELLVVPDAFEDERFHDNPLVAGEPRVRFYAGFPLTTPEGHVLGTLCAIDHDPREMTDEQLDTLRILGRQVVDQLELRRRLRSLEHSEERLRTLFETAVDAIVTIDDTGIIDRANAVVERLFGYRPSELVGRHIEMLMPPKHRDSLHLYLKNQVAEPAAVPEPVSREALAMRKDGTTFPIELSVSEMRLGRRRMFTGIVRDITERKRVDRLKSEFVSTVSHELRTPLTSIRGALGLLAGGRVGDMSPEAKEMLNIALNNSERLVRLINDILDVEKIRSGKLQFDFRELDLDAAAEEAVAANRGFAVEHDSEIVVTGSLPSVRVHADPDRLAQVFANLMSNAVKFSPTGKPIELSVEALGEHVRIGVRDWGPGVPEEFEGRLFERFAQADASDSRRTSGTGLGLSITKAIVERMGGTIGYEPADGGGSFFFFELPTAKPSVLIAPSTPPRILVCEDEPDIALLLTKILGFEGYVVDVAEDIAKARALLDDREYDAVTLDLKLGNDNGLELLDEIRGTDSSIPVVVVSAIADEARQTLNGGAVSIVDWITKPIDERRLLESITGATKTGPRRRILHVEDDSDLAVMVKVLLGDLGTLTNVRSIQEAKEQLAQGSFDLVLLDIGLPDGEGTELLPFVGVTPVIIFSAAEGDLAASEKVAASLVKSRATEGDLRKAINSVLPAAS